MPKEDSTVILKRIEKRIEKLEKQQDILSRIEKKIFKEEEVEIKEQKQELEKQTEEIDELKTLEELEKKIDKEVKKNPLTKISIKDFSKSVIGAFIGIIGHFSFFYGIEIAKDITVARATLLYIVAFCIGLLFIYFAGFRKVKDVSTSRFVPIRIIIIYVTSILVILLTLYLFGFVTHETQFVEIYKTVSTISILAVLGASTADLIGGTE
jgi:uncharacterized membrane protein